MDMELSKSLFQSLFLWIFRSYVLVSMNYESLKLGVSILVLMDLSFLPVRCYCLFSVQSNVSILVLMDLSFLRTEFKIILQSQCKVSILVLMDLSFLLAGVKQNL